MSSSSFIRASPKFLKNAFSASDISASHTPPSQTEMPIEYEEKPAILPLLEPEHKNHFKWRSGIFAVLDLGSTKTVCFIGRGLKNGSLQILGWGWRRSEGISSGNIVDAERAEAVIRTTVGEAERMAGRRVNDIVVNLSCGNPVSRHIQVEEILDGREVTPHDIQSLIDTAKKEVFLPEREIIHTLPVTFNVDETYSVFNPYGQLCHLLQGNFHIVDAHISALRTLSFVLQRAELRLTAAISSPLASGISVLDHDERELGISVIEMGAATTSLAVFLQGRLLHTAQLPIGSDMITRDIATALGLSLEMAEWLKTAHGAAQPVSDDDQNLIPLPTTHGQIINYVSRKQLVSIIAPRIEETLEMVRHCLESTGLGRVAKDRIVLTGGGALLKDLGPVAAKLFGKPVRLGQPRNILNLPETSSISSGFSTCSGLLAWCVGADTYFLPPIAQEVSNNFLKRLVNLIRKSI